VATIQLALPLRVGTRTVGNLRRRLLRVAVPLGDALAGAPPQLPVLDEGTDGYLITGAAQESVLVPPGFVGFVRQRYRRSFASLDGGFEAYLGTFSAKSRSTLRRKLRRVIERSGGALDLRCYRRPDEIADFHRLARSLSARTYQERQLGAGLPDGPEALAQMRRLAAADRLRAWILFLEGRAIAYLYLPAEGDTLIYAYLGYDPDHADLSPGNVLQFEALRRLMEEGRFRLLDFTEGEGRHKDLFSTGSVECIDMLILRRSIANRTAGMLLNGFDAAVALAKKLVLALGLSRLAAMVRR
jgi:CelD/BcsL family acetyltransferase involved in cellulose biosynthesis